MKKAKVRIEGLSALLMHRFPMEPIEAIEKKPPEEQAELAAYRDQDGVLYVAGLAIQRSMIAAATYSKGKGRGSLQKQAAACLLVEPEYVTLGKKDYAIDKRPVVVPATRGRIIRYRPRLESWKLEFTITWDETLLREPEVRKILDDAGSRVGLLDFRPACKGPFGRFMVTLWENGSPN